MKSKIINHQYIVVIKETKTTNSTILERYFTDYASADNYYTLLTKNGFNNLKSFYAEFVNLEDKRILAFYQK